MVRARGDRRREGPLDRCAGAARQAFAWSAGKQVSARDETGTVKTWTAPSTARGLAFQPKGYRLRRPITMARRSGFPRSRRAPDAGMEGLASRRDLLARRALPRHLDAGECAARLAASRCAQHAHDRLSRQDALAVLVARRRMAGDVGRRRLRRLAVQGQRRSDGQGPARMRRAPGARDRSPFIPRSSSRSAIPTGSSCSAASATRRKFSCVTRR